LDDEDEKSQDSLLGENKDGSPSQQKKAKGSSSESGSDSDDPDKEDLKSPLFMQKAKPVPDKSEVKLEVKDEIVLDETDGRKGKRKAEPSGSGKTNFQESDSPPLKQGKLSTSKSAVFPAPKGITEDEVKRYLQRKPHSTKDLVAKFKGRCENMDRNEIVTRLAEILKKLKPQQYKANGVLYFSLTNNQ